ncbi:MAG: hypothetical protein VZQ84_00460 [Anaerovoracaceae bacterium]|nr:hypothetical protein [Anaerovoracaceae bacterium]
MKKQTKNILIAAGTAGAVLCVLSVSGALHGAAEKICLTVGLCAILIVLAYVITASLGNPGGRKMDDAADSMFFYKYGNERCIDYVPNEYMRGMTAMGIARTVAESKGAVLYIGDKENEACAKFEEAVTPLLEKYGAVIGTFYESVAAAGAEFEKKRFKQDYDIDAVPCVLHVKDGEIVSRWDDPVNSLGEIEAALKSIYEK